MHRDNDCVICCRRLRGHGHAHGNHDMKIRVTLILSIVLIGTVSSECTSSDMCEYSNASLKNTQIYFERAEGFFPKSCAAVCVDRESCFGVTDDKETNTCIFHIGNEEGACPSLGSMAPGQTVYLKMHSSVVCLSVGFSP